jgi:threonine aldolase
MNDIIDNLQEKCFSMLGSINDLKQSETQNDELTNRFNNDVTELMQAVSIFFVKPSET